MSRPDAPAGLDRGAREGTRPRPRRVPARARTRRTDRQGDLGAAGQRRAPHAPQQHTPTPRLDLPRLTVPTTYRITLDAARNARLALDLIERGAFEAKHFAPGTSITQGFEAALDQALTPEEDPSATSLDVFLHRPHEGDGTLRLALVPDPGGSMPINLHHALADLDRIDARLAPALLHHVERAHLLLPAFTPETAYMIIAHLHWGGDETGEELYDQVRFDLAHDRNVEPDNIPLEEVRRIANEEMWTPENIEPHLPKHFTDYGGHPSLEGLRDILDASLFPDATQPLRDLLEHLTLTHEHGTRLRQHPHHTEMDDFYEQGNDPAFAYAVSIHPPGEQDLVQEALYEHGEYVMQSGVDFLPSVCYDLPDTPDGRTHLASLLADLKRQVALEARLHHLLRKLAHPERNEP